MSVDYLDSYNQGSGPDLVLEGLMEARKRVAKTQQPGGPQWNFQSWRTCTCGHIYAVASGGDPAPNEQAIYDAEVTDGLYEDMLKAIVRECVPYDVEGEPEVAFLVSEETAQWWLQKSQRENNAFFAGPVQAEAALALLDKTIEAIQARQREDMQQASGRPWSSLPEEVRGPDRNAEEEGGGA